MNHHIQWGGYEFKYLAEFFRRVESEPELAQFLEKLEASALEEARNHCSLMINAHGKSFLTPEKFDTLAPLDQETIISVMGQVGLEYFSFDLPSSMLSVKLSPCSPSVLACTMFRLIDKLTAVKGVLDVLPVQQEISMNLQVPLGPKPVLAVYEHFLVLCFPSLHITQSQYDEPVTPLTMITLRGTFPSAPNAPSGKTPPSTQPSDMRQAHQQKAEKKEKTFWQKLFGQR